MKLTTLLTGRYVYKIELDITALSKRTYWIITIDHPHPSKWSISSIYFAWTAQIDLLKA
jgi:hypothetical protein